MINEHEQIVCDCHWCGNLILNDGKTLLQGYIEVKDGKAVKVFSDDPRNYNPRIPAFELKNRSEYRREELLSLPVTPDLMKELDGKHFLNESYLLRYVASLIEKKQVEAAEAAQSEFEEELRVQTDIKANLALENKDTEEKIV